MPDYRNARPIIRVTPPMKKGTCQKPGCGKEFIGPGNRRWCDEHSATVKYRGRAKVDPWM